MDRTERSATYSLRSVAVMPHLVAMSLAAKTKHQLTNDLTVRQRTGTVLAHIEKTILTGDKRTALTGSETTTVLIGFDGTVLLVDAERTDDDKRAVLTDCERRTVLANTKRS